MCINTETNKIGFGSVYRFYLNTQPKHTQSHAHALKPKIRQVISNSDALVRKKTCKFQAPMTICFEAFLIFFEKEHLTEHGRYNHSAAASAARTKLVNMFGKEHVQNNFRSQLMIHPVLLAEKQEV